MYRLLLFLNTNDVEVVWNNSITHFFVFLFELFFVAHNVFIK